MTPREITNMLAREMEDKMEVASEFLVSEMIRTASGHRDAKLKAVRDSEYVNSFGKSVSRTGNVIASIIGNSAGHAPYIEFGTGEYAENGKGRKGGWVYKDPKTNKVWFTFGMRARPIMRTVMESNKNNLDRFFR